jgi:hypothetical protein
VTEHPKGFKVRSLRGALRVNNMLSCNAYALAEWQLFGSKAGAGFSGYDAFHV